MSEQNKELASEEVAAEQPKGLTMKKTYTVEVPVKQGIQNALEVVQFGVALAKAIDEAKKNDGKVDAKDLHLLMPVVPLIVPMVKDVDQVPKELGDLDETELQILLDEAGKILSETNNAKLIVKVKAALKFAHASYELYAAFKK